MSNTNKKEMRDIWELLNSYGVYTEEDIKRIEKDLKLDIGLFVTPLNKEG